MSDTAWAWLGIIVLTVLIIWVSAVIGDKNKGL